MKRQFFSLENLSLVRKVLISFFLISILPLLVAGFYFTYQFLPSYAFVILGVNILLGWWIIIQITLSIGRVVRKAQLREARKQASSYTNDEVKVLDEAFDRISDKVKNRFEELREVSRDTERLNIEISKKVSLLSTIMQINELVSQQRDMKEVFELITARISEILNADICFILLDNNKGSLEAEEILSEDQVEINPLPKTTGFIKPLLEKKQMLIYDKENNQDADLGNYAKQECKINSLALVPVHLGKKIVGVIGAGKKEEDTLLSEDDVDSLSIFAKHLGFLFEHREIRFKVKELEVRDSTTGLYNTEFLQEKLDEKIRIAMKRQSSCGLIIIKINNLRKYIEDNGIFSFEKVIRIMSVTLTEELTDAQIGRIKEDELGAVISETGKAELERKAENVLAKIKERLPDSKELDLRWATAENPIDGATAEELIEKARNHINK
jgi:diguanylate cyclase (GGDEF)-like protein